MSIVLDDILNNTTLQSVCCSLSCFY